MVPRGGDWSLESGVAAACPAGPHRHAGAAGAYCSGSRVLSQFALFQPLDVVAQLERRPQFQTHVFHDHVASQQQQSFSVDLLSNKGRESLGLIGSIVITADVTEKLKEHTCFLNSSACGANAVGSASLTNCITSSMDQEEGFLLDMCAPSRSDVPRDSGPVVELAAKQAEHTC